MTNGDRPAGSGAAGTGARTGGSPTVGGKGAGSARPGGDARRLHVRVIAPTQKGFEGEARSVVAPAYDGKLGILYGHAPMTVLLGEGELVLRTDTGTRQFHVSRGFLQVVDNVVSVLAEEVETLDGGAPPEDGEA